MSSRRPTRSYGGEGTEGLGNSSAYPSQVVAQSQSIAPTARWVEAWLHRLAEKRRKLRYDRQSMDSKSELEVSVSVGRIEDLPADVHKILNAR